jgi:enolase
MIELDGTPNKAGSAPTPSSASRSRSPRRRRRRAGLPLYRYVGGTSARVLPVPMMNIINGGVHADNPIDFQEFMIMPVGAPTFAEALRMGAEVFHALKKALKDAGHNTNVGDEGGFAPNLPSADAALGFRHEGDRGKAGYKARARTSCWRSTAPRPSSSRTALRLEGEGKQPLDRRRAWATTSPSCVARYPIVSIEDGMAEDDWDGWKALTDLLGAKVPARRRRPVRHQPERGCRGHRARASPTRSWSRSTRSAR